MVWEAEPIVPPETPEPGNPQHRAAGLITLIPPTGRPVSWEELKVQRRLSTDAEKSLGEMYIDAASDYAEDAMSCTLMARTYLKTFYNGERLTLPRGPLLGVVSVRGHGDNADRPYDISHSGNLAEVVISGSVAYPVSVTYRAGHETAAAIPAGIRLCLLQHAATMHDNRESVSDRTKTPVPHSLADFYARKSRSTGVA
jgi:hypothetical protein